eukprot:Protomagalhaensia_sp_Gyna_25__3104@NODE_2846_length_860_cov_3_373934_g2375_i0_p1_GENE_NODE_2846_length_860_cov_3_373934_g2375_i0NODE_2846_length_860_cov_3_373934_g2375_i0_p1_ORF_typecomplete_len114_score2_69_NODE_2846_length_860_cov_3_373934_g2375_i095436
MQILNFFLVFIVAVGHPLGPSGFEVERSNIWRNYGIRNRRRRRVPSRGFYQISFNRAMEPHTSIDLGNPLLRPRYPDTTPTRDDYDSAMVLDLQKQLSGDLGIGLDSELVINY